MKRVSSTHRVTTNSSFGPSVGWEELPVLGEKVDGPFRALIHRAMLGALMLIWGAVALAIYTWSS